MNRYEYKITPAPAKGQKARGIKGPEARFAHTLEQSINALASEGWEYLRADILPSEERQGLTSSQTVYRSVLVFRRELAASAADDTAIIATPAAETGMAVANDDPAIGATDATPDDGSAEEIALDNAEEKQTAHPGA